MALRLFVLYSPFLTKRDCRALKKGGGKPRKEVMIVLLYRIGAWFDTYGQICVELIAFALSALA